MAKKRFEVTIKEMYTATRIVEAETEDEARDIVEEELEEVGIETEYSHTLDTFEWDVQEIHKKEAKFDKNS